MKKVLSSLLAFIMLFSTLTVTNVCANAEIKKDYLYWSQADSTKPWANMSIARDRHSSCTFSKYGCWIMSYTKLLIMTGIKDQDKFGPVDMINWIVDNKVTDNNGELIAGHQNIISNTYNLKYIGKIDCSSYTDANNKIIEQVNNGYNVLVRMNGHTVIVDNDLTKQNGYTTVSNSWNNSNYNVPLTYFTNTYSMKFIDVFQGDTIKPSLSNIKTSSLTSKGYTISCTATDNIGVASVTFDTYKGDKLIDSEKGSQNGNTWRYKFDKATVSGSYYTKIIAKDSVGNVVSKNTKTVSVKCKVASPKITSSNTTGGKNISISCPTSGSTIYYKTSKDGKYKKYTGKFKLTSTKNIYAYATKSNYSNSPTVNKKVSVGKVATPTISTKNYIGGKTVSISTSTSDATIYYKTSSKADYKKYTGSFKITNTKTIYAYAKKSGSKNSSAAKKKISISTTTKPTGMKATASSSSAIKVSWKQVRGASGYYIYQATSKKGTYKKVATVTKGTTLSKSVGSLSANKTYYFKVKAYTSGKKTSAYSTVVSAKTKSANSKIKQTICKGTWTDLEKYPSYTYYSNSFVFSDSGYVTIKDNFNTSKKVKYSTTSNGEVKFVYDLYGNGYTDSVTIKQISGSNLLSAKIVEKSSGYSETRYTLLSNSKYVGNNSTFLKNVQHTYWESNNSYFDKEFGAPLIGIHFNDINTNSYYGTHLSGFFDCGHHGVSFAMYGITNNVMYATWENNNSEVVFAFLEKVTNNKINVYIYRDYYTSYIKDTWKR